MTRKQIIRTIPLAILFVVAACSKKTEPIATPLPVPATKISKLQNEHYSIEATYHADGRIAGFNNKSVANPIDNDQYAFVYDQHQIAEVNFAGRWKYTYVNNRVTKVQSYTPQGLFRYQTELTYNNNGRVEERIESKMVSDIAYPQFRTVYSYHADGNISKKEVFQYVNHSWLKNEDVEYPEYDNHENLSQALESAPYVPTAFLFVNNPKKELYIEIGIVTQTITYTYIYDSNGRVTSRTATHVYRDGTPDYVNTVKMFY